MPQPKFAKTQGSASLPMRKPDWLRVKLPAGEDFTRLKGLFSELRLNTVCEEARCPNVHDCWGRATATVMLMGDVCTRACKFCMVKSGNPHGQLDREEPFHVAKAITSLGLRYVVLTSVDRDDLPDGGASHFAQTVRELRNQDSSIVVEVLIPDFRGDLEAIRKIVEAGPNVVAHNIEVVKRLTPQVRDVKAGYNVSITVLKTVKELAPQIYTKSSIMVGLGETYEEVTEVMRDLKSIGVNFLTIGQYLQPSRWHLPVVEYVRPEVFRRYEDEGLQMGFLYVASGPLVRSSYRAGELFVEKILRVQKPSKNAD